LTDVSRLFRFQGIFATIHCVKISAVLITLNEEKNIAAALESVSWADEILVVDSGSSDGTQEVAQAVGARVIAHEWEGFSRQKQFATDAAAFDMVLSVDADERVSPELQSQIAKVKDGANPADGYRIPRLAHYMGRPIRHSGWYPDRQVRLFDRRRGRWKESLVHESVAMDASAGIEDLSGDILHFPVENAAHHHRMIGERYAPLAARQMLADGRRTSVPKLLASGPAAFIRSYIVKGGFLDGLPGFVIAGFAAHHAFLKHLMLLELQRDPDR
jgi:glycosyltransferase involved in cell wall biosynthesis